jgi:ribosome biogenesis GTPase / thiamine phosphate phosphatase
MNLESLGAGAPLLQLFQPHAARGLVLARVAVSHRDHYRLITESGELEAEPSGRLWYEAAGNIDLPVAGDWVAARAAAPGQAIVEAVLPRRTLFSRRAPGRREDQQPIAANIDLVFLVCGLDGDYNLRRLERYLALAAESGAAPVIVLNKTDLCGDLEARLAETAAVSNGAPVVPCSAATAPLEGLMSFLAPGRTVALLGSSGAGKSTIVNRILGEDRLRTAGVRESDSRGRHTTTHRELVPLPQGGALIDTPGMRELQLWAGEESVDRAFEEIAALAEACRFRDCSHSGELGCAVAEALTRGDLAQERWESYRKLLAEARRHERLADPLAALEQKRKWKAIHKAYRHYDKSKR